MNNAEPTRCEMLTKFHSNLGTLSFCAYPQ